MTSKDFFERLEHHFYHKHPFVVFKKPNQETICAYLQKNDTLYFANDYSETGFVFAPFDDTEKTILIPHTASEIYKIRYKTTKVATENSVKHDKNNSNPFETVSKNNHINLVNQGVEAIKTSKLKKIVLSRQEIVNLSTNDLFFIFKNLLKHYKNAFVYCWYHPKVGLWLGATPETLLKIEGSKFSIMALAGTQDYQGTLAVDWKKKDIEEQQIVTNFIIDTLKPITEHIKISSVETVKAGNLLHLKTMITAQLKPNINLEQLLKSIHPTPAVCGLPKPLSKQFILKNEGYNREYYTGFLGELNIESTKSPRLAKQNIKQSAYSVSKKSTQLYVNLRCMQIKNHHAIIYIGGGITEHSIAMDEWNETVSKSLVIKSVL